MIVGYTADVEWTVAIADTETGVVVDWDGIGAEGAIEGLDIDEGVAVGAGYHGGGASDFSLAVVDRVRECLSH